MMNIDQREWEDLRQDVRDTKLAVCGDPKLGVTGLVSRVAKLEKRQRKWDLRLLVVTTGLAGIGLFLKRLIIGKE